MGEPEYQIEYSIQRSDASGDFVEIGFGSSGSCSTPVNAALAVECAIQAYGWETEKDQPEPDQIKEEVESR